MIKKVLSVIFLSMVMYGCLDSGGDPLLSSSMTSSAVSAPRKKVIVFYSKGGGGHVSVANAIKSYIGNRFDVELVDVFGRTLRHIDLLRYMTFKRFSGEDLYDYMLRNRTSGGNQYVRFGGLWFRFNKRRITNILQRYFKKQQADMAISVVPLINGALLRATKKLHMPFMVVTNDLDTVNYINGLKKPRHPAFLYTLPFDDEIIRRKMARACIPEQNLCVTGFPLRHQFFTQKNKNDIRREFNIPTNKPTVMILMGGAGSKGALRYAQQIAKDTLPVHVVIVAGRDAKLKKRLERMSWPKHISTTILGFTKRISDLMYASDVLITKPGPNSICEALQMNVPMLIDRTGKLLYWERLNIEFALKHGFGEQVKKYRQLPLLLRSVLKTKSYRVNMQKNMVCYDKPDFAVRINEYVDELFNRHARAAW